MEIAGQKPDYHLYRRSRTPVWLALSWRALLALGLIGIALAVHWFDRDGLRQSSGEPVTFTDILYFTMITVTTVGYGDIVPVTQQSRLFDTFVVTPIRLFVWLPSVVVPIVLIAHLAAIRQLRNLPQPMSH